MALDTIYSENLENRNYVEEHIFGMDVAFMF